MKRITVVSVALVFAVSAFAVSAFGNGLRPAVAKTTSEAIDFPGFLKISKEVQKVRKTRLLSLDEFLDAASDAGTLVLDTRSESAYAAKHLAGATHLNFSDLTEESLARVVGSRDRRVLIYCNNNFADDVSPFLTKKPGAALNIPTFVSLWAYGYRNVYELGDVLEQSDPRLAFEGLLVGAVAQVATR